MDMFKELQSLVDSNQVLNTEKFGDVQKTTDGLDARVTELEEQIKFLSQPVAPVEGAPDPGPGLMNALNDMRKELNEKIAALEKRVTDCEETDDKQQGEIDELKAL